MAMLEERGVKHELEHDIYVEWIDERGNEVIAFETLCKHKGDVLIVHMFLTPEQAIAVTLGSQNVTSNQESIVRSFLRTISPNRDWDYLGEHEHALIADLISDIAATLESDNEYERKMDTLLCRLTNGKWSKSRAYSIEFMDACISEEFEALYSDEQFSAPVYSMLTAEQVREAIERHSMWVIGNNRCFHDGAYEEISDELNCMLGNEQLKIENELLKKSESEKLERIEQLESLVLDLAPFVCEDDGIDDIKERMKLLGLIEDNE